MKKYSLVLLAAGLMASPQSFAGDVEINSPQERFDYIKKSDTWQKPAWMDANFNFDPSFDITRLPRAKEGDVLLEQDNVVCQMTEELATQDRGDGKSPKFHCLLMSYNNSTAKWEVLKDSKGKTRKIKVKYNNGEVYAEVIAARLLRALGFGADLMYPVMQVSCFGCTIDPWNIRQRSCQ